jgi:hypothetical protein
VKGSFGVPEKAAGCGDMDILGDEVADTECV